MATSNFAGPVNAAHIYAINMNHYDEELQKTVYPDYIDWLEEKEYLRNMIAEIFPKVVDYSNDNIYAFRVTKSILNKFVEVEFEITVQSGYYEGAMVDWEIRGTVDDYDFEYEDGTVYLGFVEDHLQLKGTKTLEKGIKALIDQTNKKLDKLFMQTTTALGVTARFSNGETLYQKIN